MATARKELEGSLNKLSISQAQKQSKSKKEEVAESWDDEELDSGEETDRPIVPTVSADYPAAPPPTPITPSILSERTNLFTESWNSSPARDPSGNGQSDRRPEKTDAVAKRMIAAGLGLRAPKKTEEQKAYDKAVKEKELKRIQAEKEAKARQEEEVAKAKAAIWDD